MEQIFFEGISTSRESQRRSNKSSTSAPSHPPTTNAVQHGHDFDVRHPDAHQGFKAPDTMAGTGILPGKTSGMNKGKETGKKKVKPAKKVHKCTHEGCDKTFITPAHVRRHLRTRE